MQSDHSNTALDYYSQLLPSLQQPPPLQPLTSSALASFSLTQQPSLQHTMSVADPFSPSWPQLFNPPSPAARKQSGAVFGGGNANWLESAQQLLPTVSSAGLSLGGMSVQSQLSQLSQLNASMMQRASQQQSAVVPLQSLSQQSSAVFQPLPQRAGVSTGVSQMMQSSPPLQSQMMPNTITAQQLAQLNQLRAQQLQQQQQQQAYSPQRVQSMAGMTPMQAMQPFSSPPQTLQTNALSLLQSFRPTMSTTSTVSPVAPKQPVAPLQLAVGGNSVELATALLSYLSSVELQRGLLYVNRLWRFKSLYVLQSRHVNVQVQLTHLYLGPFRAANMLELVFSLQVHPRLVNGTTSVSNTGSGTVNTIQSPVQPLRPLQLPKSVPSSPASVTRTPQLSAGAPTVLNSPSAIARATVCTPMALSAVVKAKELSKGDALLSSPSMMLGGGKHLSKKKLREAALLAESKYNSVIECGILPAGHTALSTSSHSPQRIFKLYSPFFTKQVEVYTALSDPTQQTLYRASSLAEKFDYATNKVGMYLSRRRLHSGGIYQATGFRSKPAGRTGLKCGGYFLTIEACKEFENHFQYGGLTEEQRKEKAGAGSDMSGVSGGGVSGSVGSEKHGVVMEASEEVDEGEMGDGEESEDADDEVDHHTVDKVKVEDKPHVAVAVHHRPLSAVTKKLVDTGFGHSPSSSASVNSRKRSASNDSPDNSPDSGDMSFKRVRSDDGGLLTTDSGSGSDSAGNRSSASVGKQGSGSDEDSSERSPGRSSRTTHFHSHSHSQLHSSSASTTSTSSVGSSSSFHRSAFKAPTPMRSSSFQPSPSSVASNGSNSNMESTSPPPAVRDISPSSSPGSQQVPTLPASASFLPSISSSSPSRSFSATTFPSMSRWHSFGSPMMSPTGTQSLFSTPSAATSYVQLSSPPMGVAHQFNGLSLAVAAASQSANTSMPAPVVPLSQSSTCQSLEAAFASALLQSGQASALGLNGPSASVGANGLLNLNNLTLQQLQQLLSGHLNTSHPAAQQLNQHNQQQSLMNFVLMSAGSQATSALQQAQSQQTVQQVQFG